MASALRALPTVQPEPSPALGASVSDWGTIPRSLYVVGAKTDGIVYTVTMCNVPYAMGPEVRYDIRAIPGPTHEQLLADALALEEVRALAEACRDVIAEREIDGQGDCGCDMCMAVDRMTITLAKLKVGV
jgi:hypothetical protein